MSIAITGSTGGYGSRVIQTLSTLVSPSSIIALTRDTSSPKARLLPKGVTLRQADFRDGASLQAGFKDAKIALIVSLDSVGEEARKLTYGAIDTAVSAGVDKIFYTSHQASSPSSHFAPARDHYAIEQYLEEKAARGGVEFTSLRNGFYMKSLKAMIPGVEHSLEIHKPADGKITWTHHDDLADAAALLLSREADTPAPKYVTLVNPHPVDMAQLAKTLSGVLNKEVKRTVQDDQEFVDTTVKYGVPKFMAEMFLGMFHEAKAGGFLSDDQALEDILGRKPIGLEEYFKREFQA